MRFKLQIFVVLLFFFSLGLFAQKNEKNLEFGSPNTTIFTTKDYNGEAQNFDFIQDEKGVLYVANTLGFLKFNGTSWENLKSKEQNIPLSFCKTPQGEIFTGGIGFIGVLKTNENGNTYMESLNKKLPKDFIIGLVWDIFYKDNKIYFRNDNNIIVYENNSVYVIETPGNINNLFKHQNTIYFNDKRGLYEIKDMKPVFIENSKILSGKNIRKIIKTNNHTTLIITLQSGFFILKENKIVPLKTKISNFLKDKLVYTTTILNDNNILFSTVKGGILFTDNDLNPIYRITTKGGLSENSVKKIKQDSENNLWIGTDNGVTKIKYPITTTFFNHNKSKIGTVQEITSHNNSVFIGSTTGTFKLKNITEKDLLTDSHYSELYHLPNDNVENFANISLGNKLLFSGYNGVSEYANNKSKLFNSFSARKFYKSIYHKNILFLGHALGCEILFLNDKNDIVKTKNITNIPEIRGIAEDGKDRLWLTSVSGGVHKITFSDNFNNIQLKKYKTSNGLPSLRDILVYNINNKEVVFTTAKGLYKFNDSKDAFVPETRFGEKYSGGKNEYIFAFDIDDNRDIWLHSLRKKNTAAYLRDKKEKYKLEETLLKGISDKQIYKILSEPDKDVVWFGGPEGLIRFDIAKATKTNNKPFYAVISKIKAETKDSTLVKGHLFDKSLLNNLSPSIKDMRFEVGATDFTFLDRNKFQYKLEGYDKKWSNWTKEPFKIYTNLSHGKYKFRVRAKNYTNEISKEDFYSFSILPFWYQTLLFKILALLTLIVVLSLVISYFSKRKFIKKVYELELEQKFETEKNKLILEEKEKSLEAIINAQEEERSKIARELHDGVVQQIGSVILRSRNLLVRKKSIEDKEHKEILKSLENSNTDLRNISHQMKPRVLKELGIISALKELLFSLDYVNIKHSFEFFNIDNRLPEKIEVTIYRISQEFINNIIKHSKASQVNIQLYTHNNFVIFIVEDNGVGFKEVTTRKGIGLLNISSRLNLIKGVVNYETSPEKGTIITVKIPL